MSFISSIIFSLSSQCQSAKDHPWIWQGSFPTHTQSILLHSNRSKNGGGLLGSLLRPSNRIFCSNSIGRTFHLIIAADLSRPSGDIQEVYCFRPSSNRNDFCRT
uniref:Uncharacterized protein n=1 Tax=Ombrophytum subterraneum TaxID=50155 RepID=A0A6M8PL44_9MAGN|nr:hypothetical protein [Ombrophytum subterraneum]